VFSLLVGKVQELPFTSEVLDEHEFCYGYAYLSRQEKGGGKKKSGGAIQSEGKLYA